MPIFDAHLDLSMNVRRGRDITRPASQQPQIEREIATVGLPDLRQGGVTHVCATIFCEPAIEGRAGYQNADEAFAETMAQIGIYRELEQRALMRRGLDRHAEPSCTRYLLLLEGADAIRNEADVQALARAGVQIVGLAWRATRHAGGTGAPGPLTPLGRQTVAQLDAAGMIHDVSHLAEQSFWDLLELAHRPVIASHSNCRAIVGEDPGARHLSDEMIRALIARNGIVGINVYDRFLLPHDEYGTRRATLADVVAHVRRVCDIAGSVRHVGLGTDMDGGLGREQIPVEFASSADLPRIGEALRSAGFSDTEVGAILFDNWYHFFSTHLS